MTDRRQFLKAYSVTTKTQRHKGGAPRIVPKRSFSWRSAFVSLCLCGLVLAAAPILAQSSKESLARLIETGNRKAALDRIRAGADVNEAQPDGTHPIHWAVVDRWFDPECPDVIVRDRVCHSFCAMPESVLT